MRKLEGDIEIDGSLRVNGVLIDGSGGGGDDGYITEAQFFGHIEDTTIHFTAGSLGGLYAPVIHTHVESDIVDFGSYETSLGNPSQDGYVLSSLIDGTRSWIKIESGVGSLDAVDIQVANGSGLWDVILDGYNVQNILESIQEEIDILQRSLGSAIDGDGVFLGFAGEIVDEVTTFTDAIEILDEGYSTLKGKIENVEETYSPKSLLDGYEVDLGLPEQDGYILSSLIDGTRSWIKIESGGVQIDDNIVWSGSHEFEQPITCAGTSTFDSLLVTNGLDFTFGPLTLNSSKVRFGTFPTEYTLPSIPGEIGDALTISDVTVEGTGIPYATLSWQSSEGNFLGLTDTPEEYTGAAGKLVAVNGTADGLEFVDLGNTYEENLGNPTVSGYILSSDTSGNRSWIEMSGGSGSSSFVDLDDVPSDYSNQGQFTVKVNSATTALEFKKESFYKEDTYSHEFLNMDVYVFLDEEVGSSWEVFAVSDTYWARAWLKVNSGSLTFLQNESSDPEFTLSNPGFNRSLQINYNVVSDITIKFGFHRRT